MLITSSRNNWHLIEEGESTSICGGYTPKLEGGEPLPRQVVEFRGWDQKKRWCSRCVETYKTSDEYIPMSKGKRRERQARKHLEAKGYDTFSPPEVKYGDTDIFNLFDIVASDGTNVKFIQVKSNEAKGINDWTERASDIMPVETVDVEFWVCHDREGWRKLALEPDGSYHARTDARDSEGMW